MGYFPYQDNIDKSVNKDILNKILTASNRKEPTLKITTVTFLILLLAAPAIMAAEDIKIPEKFVEQPSKEIVSSRALDYLSSKAGDGLIKVWVFFTDKGIFEQGTYLQRAEEYKQALTERALQRRAKNNAPLVSFADLPVENDYIEQLESLGLEHRRSSNWLNAASFETTFDKLETISELPFVKKIQPMATYVREPAEIQNESPKNNLTPDDTRDYGNSYDQLQQINVIAAHDSGWTGEGVLVAMFDTGFRTSHQAFANIMAENRLLATYDFVFDDTIVDNELEDNSSAWNHGTYTWSTLGGEYDGFVYGPSYNADFILCKTEDVRSETQIEEDNWVSAVEFVDSLGADIISSSLGYTDWYIDINFNGDFCVTTIAADYAASVGILVVNSAGNNGPGSSTIIAPADADSILSIGAVYGSGGIVYFSSRGPTYDGRIKPEVCARGSSVTCASPTSTTSMSSVSGTSLSCPLVGGAAAIIMSARPNWTAMMVRDALMYTASQAHTPDNDYGWGIIDVIDAIHFAPYNELMKGDANNDNLVNISDAVHIINYVFSSGPEPIPEILAGDANDDDSVDISDATYIVNWVFVPGSPPPAGLL